MLPKTIFVQENAPEGDDARCLLVDETPLKACNHSPAQGPGAGEVVGVYELQRTVRFVATTTVTEEPITNES